MIWKILTPSPSPSRSHL